MDFLEERQENTELLEEYLRTGDVELRNKVVESYLYLVKILVGKFTNKGVDYDDLMQVGALALLNAAERFNPDRGYEFATFATPTIIGEIKRHFRDKSWAVRIPRRITEITTKLPIAREKLTMELGRAPRIPEIAEYMGYSEEEILEALENAHAHSAVSLDQNVSEEIAEEEYSTLAEMTGAEDAAYESFENAELIQQVISSFSDKEHKIFTQWVLQNRTQQEIADDMGVSQMTVSRLENEIKARFRKEYYRER